MSDVFNDLQTTAEAYLTVSAGCKVFLREMCSVDEGIRARIRRDRKDLEEKLASLQQTMENHAATPTQRKMAELEFNRLSESTVSITADEIALFWQVRDQAKQACTDCAKLRQDFISAHEKAKAELEHLRKTVLTDERHIGAHADDLERSSMTFEQYTVSGNFT